MLAAGALVVAGCGEDDTPTTPASAAPSAGRPDCVLTADRTEGPYFVDERLDRSDIRAGQAGVPLALTFVVMNARCQPLQGAMVDIWHCNALGAYSDVEGNSDTFLRGFQRTDGDGRCAFTTIYPGWYSGRAIHVHFKVRHDGREFTSQLFFDPATSGTVLRDRAYGGRGEPDVPNSADGIYGPDGDTLLLRATADGKGGYRSIYRVGLAA